MQDIVSDAGLWRSFVDANRELYGWSVPFHEIPENYIDYELNREDVRFLVWYTVAMLWEEQRFIFPHDARLLDFADGCFAILEEVYDDAPVPENSIYRAVWSSMTPMIIRQSIASATGSSSTHICLLRLIRCRCAR